MWNFKIKTKIVVSLIVLMSISAQALDLSSYITTYKSSAGSWSSPTTGMKYHYGGTYEFTFKGGNKFQPWITASEPSIEIGCNGISLKGGFIGLLGLNELKEQISDAGQSLAWGAFISLQYAVPGLFQVFTKIREWAAAIQGLMQNACAIGKTLATSSTVQNRIQQSINHNLQLEGISNTLTTWMNGGDSMLTKVQELTSCAGLSNATPSNGGPSPYAKCVSGLASDSSPATTTSKNVKGGSHNIDKAIVRTTVSENKLYVDKLSSVLGSGKIDNKMIASTSEQREDVASTLKLLRVFFGDIALESESYKEIIAKDTTAYGTPYTKGTYIIDTEQITKKRAAAAGGNKIPVIKPKYTVVKSVIASSEAAAKALIHGISSNTDETNCGDGYCYIDNPTVYYYDFGSSSNRSSAAGIVDDGKFVLNSSLKLSWSGAYNESMKSIRKKVLERTGYAPTWKTVYDDNNAIDTSLSTTVPLLVPNVSNYIDTIVKLEKLNEGETALSAHLKTVIAQQNSVLLAKSLFSIIEGKMISAELSGGKEETVLKFSEHINDVSRRIQAELEKIDITSQNLNAVSDLFSKIEEDLQNKKVTKY